MRRKQQHKAAMSVLTPLSTSLLGPRGEGDPDSESVPVNPSDDNFNHHVQFSPINHSSYHHIPTARSYEPGMKFK